MTKLSLLFLTLCTLASAAPVVDLDKRLADLETATKAAQSAGDNAWMLTSAALVLMMPGPGPPLFYGGLARTQNVLPTMLQSFPMLAPITVLSPICGSSLSFACCSSSIGNSA